MVRSLQQRDRHPELMDCPDIAPADHARALCGLSRLNRASGIERTVFRALKPLLRDEPVRVLDIAAGSGDLVTGLARRMSSAGTPVLFTACDISAFACQQIKDRASGLPGSNGSRIEVTQCDVVNDPLPQGHDIVMCHLFLHHLDEEEIVRLLRAMRESARKAVIITDLRRSRRGYLLAWLASRLLTRSRVVHTDALLSVRAALTPHEIRHLAISAGYNAPCIRRIWPQRILLKWNA